MNYLTVNLNYSIYIYHLLYLCSLYLSRFSYIIIINLCYVKYFNYNIIFNSNSKFNFQFSLSHFLYTEYF